MKEPLSFQGRARNGPKGAQLTQVLKPSILKFRHLYDSVFKKHPEARRTLILLKDIIIMTLSTKIIELVSYNKCSKRCSKTDPRVWFPGRN